MPEDYEPSSIRNVFGQNLRQLVQGFTSVSHVCRMLDINRAQFNRYLNGESYPRPDTLHKMCKFFGTDARILTQALDELPSSRPGLMDHPELAEFAVMDDTALSEDLFPSGFYRFSRQSFLYPEKFITGLIYVYRRDGWTFIKGSEARQSVVEQGLPMDARTRQFRGYVLQLEDGVGAMISRRNALTCTFNFLTQVPSLNRNHWNGYAVRTVSETLNATRAVRMVYEYLEQDAKSVLPVARCAGFCEFEDLPAFHRRLLRPQEPFS